MKFRFMLGIEFHSVHIVSAVVEGFGARSRPSEQVEDDHFVVRFSLVHAAGMVFVA